MFAMVVFVVPALAGSAATPTIEAVEKAGAQYSNEKYSWSPETVSVAPGGTVDFAAAPGSQHGVVWKEVPATPSCTGVPIGSAAAGWKGSCTFTQVGSYTFYDYAHPEARGTVTVAGGPSYTSAQTATSETKLPGENSSSPFVGGQSQAITLAASQHGTAVKGTVDLSEAGAQGKLVVELLASKASIAKRSSHSSQVTVGKSVNAGLKPGVVSFSVPLNAAGKKALHRRHSLALSVHITFAPHFGAPIKLSRTVTLHS